MTNEQLELALVDLTSLTAQGLTNISESINNLVDIAKLITSRLEVLERKVNQ